MCTNDGPLIIKEIFKDFTNKINTDESQKYENPLEIFRNMYKDIKELKANLTKYEKNSNEKFSKSKNFF